MQEKQIEKLICLYIEQKLCMKVYNIEKGMRLSSSGEAMPFRSAFALPNGVSDLLVIKEGKCSWLEVKTPKELKYVLKHYDKIKEEGDNQRAMTKKRAHLYSQIKFIEDMRLIGCKAGFCDSVESAVELLDNTAS